jgi:peptidyl-prolyl cis-trans isomerase B (cyclophilin B)
MPSDKRDRQRQNRALGNAERDRLLRRRRTTRLVAGVVIITILLVVAFTLFSGSSNNKSTTAHQAATPSPTDTLVPTATSQLPTGCKNAKRPAQGPATLPSPAPGRYARSPKTYAATIHTNCGDIKLSLDAKQAPQTVNNFIYLANKGYYDGLYWHRIVQNFVIQAGDPNGKDGLPPDGPGYTIPDEYPAKSNQYTFGTIAMANSGQPHSGGGQFFFVVHEKKNAKGSKRFSEPAGLQPQYSIFGKVSKSSFPVLERIAKTPVVGGTGQDQSEPVAPVFITSIDVSS